MLAKQGRINYNYINYGGLLYLFIRCSEQDNWFVNNIRDLQYISLLEGDIIMKKVSFRVRNFDKEQFLTYDVDNEAVLDEEVLDFLEDEEPKGLVPIIFEEGEECDTFSYDVTDKIRLCELSNQEINAEMVLRVMRGLVLSFIDMGEYRVPLSYLVLNRNYIYINSDYEVEFICIPLEEMQEEVDLNMFLRNFVASLRFESSENGDYVARLLSYINNTAIFNLRNMLALVEDLMDACGVEIPEDTSADIYVDYQEVEDEEDVEEVAATEEDVVEDTLTTEELVDEAAEEEVDSTEDEEELEEVLEDEVSEESTEPEEIVDEADEEEIVSPEEEAVDEEVEEEQVVEPEPVVPEAEDEVEEVVQKKSKKTTFKTKEASMPTVVIEDDFDEFIAEKEKAEQEAQHEESGLKIRKNIKVNRASVVKSNQEETQDVEESTELDAETNETTASAKKAVEVPKANPYLIRVNTEERIMITKQNFKVGKASMGVDYTVKGNGAVSRVHAIITCKDDIYYIKDNKSTNHTVVNGKILEDGENEALTNDCKIVLGDEEFVFKMG